MNIPEGYDVSFTGELEQQQETAGFLGVAFGTALALMLLILVTQLIPLNRLLYSARYCSLDRNCAGFGLFYMKFSVVMTGVGIFFLAGNVVRNGILLISSLSMSYATVVFLLLTLSWKELPHVLHQLF